MEKTSTFSINSTFSPDNWVDEHADYLYRFASFRIQDPALAEDLVQETFLSALKNYSKFGHDSCERTWLVSILKNKIIDQYRLMVRHSSPDDEALPGYFTTGVKKGRWNRADARLVWPEDVGDRYDQKEFGRFVKICLTKIPEKLANIFIMREIDGYSTKEICKELGVSSSNVWVMLHRARHLLRDCLQKDGYGSEGDKSYAI